VCEVFDSDSALELNPEVLTLTPGKLCEHEKRIAPADSQRYKKHHHRCSAS